jgi:hypothetical protein
MGGTPEMFQGALQLVSKTSKGRVKAMLLANPPIVLFCFTPRPALTHTQPCMHELLAVYVRNYSAFADSNVPRLCLHCDSVLKPRPYPYPCPCSCHTYKNLVKCRHKCT